MIVAGSGRFTKFADPTATRTATNARLQSRGYRVIWGPRLVEPIEPDMYSNGIAPQLDPERTESKVVDSVSNAAWLYVVNVVCLSQINCSFSKLL